MHPGGVMTAEDLPETVRRFLAQCVSSPDELRILLTLIDSEGRWWDADTLAPHTRLSPVNTRRVLDSFASRNLLDIRISDAVRYRLRPGTRELQAGVAAVAEAVRRSPGAVWTWAGGFAGAPRLQKSGGDLIGIPVKDS
jgi:hypothetical protein